MSAGPYAKLKTGSNEIVTVGFNCLEINMEQLVCTVSGMYKSQSKTCVRLKSSPQRVSCPGRQLSHCVSQMTDARLPSVLSSTASAQVEEVMFGNIPERLMRFYVSVSDLNGACCMI